MATVAIVGIQNLKHMTTVSMYTDVLNRNNIPYDIIYMDKYGIDEPHTANRVFKFDAGKLNGNLLSRISVTLKYKRFVERIIKQEKYEFIILWREEAIALFAGFVSKRYRGAYSVNVRDLWNPKRKWITKGISKAVKYSAFNTVCSDGFIPYLPKAKYQFVHCINYDALKQIAETKSEKKKDGPIVITYIGTIRFFDYCCRIINYFDNDERFELRFIGQGSEKIKQFAEDKGFRNVKCIGTFDSDKTASLISGSDILNCAYGAKSNAEKTLLPIRFYYAVYMGLPVLTTEGTWIDEVAKNNGMNITVPDTTIGDFPEYVYNKYQEIDFEEMKNLQREYIKIIVEQFKVFEEKLLESLKETRNDHE